MGLLQRFLAIAALGALTACDGFMTDNPIGGSEGSHADPRLIGVWKVTEYQSAGQVSYMFISPKKGGGGLHALVVGWNPTEQSESSEFDIVTGSAGGDTFVNLNHILKNGKPMKNEPPGYLPFAYQIDSKGEFVIYDPTAAGKKLVKAAIDAHKLKAKVTIKKGSGKRDPNDIDSMDIRLTSDQKSLDAFFDANAKAIYTDKIDTFTPVKLP